MRSLHESTGEIDPENVGIPVSRQEPKNYDDRAERLREVLKALYPELNEKERNLAARNLMRYFEIALVVAEEKERSDARLTHPDTISSMKERSNVKFTN
jgi:hypothetical protein